ncbi:DUF2784 domain-containing protein [Planosporangium sp. 12N6]|uniref:DUF2784 domain-containing protein n=1 Tax=Planosporangium spinosum TaxID=3402278 RepID=UPI003CEB46D1
MAYRLLVTAILVTHFGYLAYVVLGGLPAIRWPRLFWPHLAAVAWGFAVTAFRLPCPLTAAEDWARRQAGEAGLTRGFIDRYIEGVLYPARYTELLRLLVAVVVAGTWLLAYRRWRAGRAVVGAGSATR